MKLPLASLSRAPARWLLLAALLIAGSLPGRARAGGLYLMPRGAETAGRGGASVAGVRSPHALWYNPAGLVDSKRQLLVDFVLPVVQTEFTRRYDNGSYAPTVSADSAAVPIPTLAFSHDFGFERLAIGAGLIVPPGHAAEWPERVNGERAPQRYSILDARGSFLASLALGAAYQATEHITIGGALYLTMAQVGGTVAVSACDYAFCAHPEGREWEGRTRFLLGPVYTATAIFGITAKLASATLGASLQLPTKIAGEAQFDITLPDQSIFDDIRVENADGGEDLRADMSIVLPTILRLGAAFTPLQRLELEVATTWEHWSQQKNLSVEPKGVVARDVPSIGDVEAQPVTLARNMKDTWAVHLGGRYDLTGLFQTRRALSAQAGFMYETGAFADRDLSPTTIDTDKVLLSLGASMEISPGFFLDASYGHLFMRNRNVRNSRVLLPAAIKPLPEDDDPSDYELGDRPAIGNGKYVMEANFVGVGLRWLMDEPAKTPIKPAPVTPQPASVGTPTPTEAPVAPPGAPASTPLPPAAPAAAPSSRSRERTGAPQRRGCGTVIGRACG